MESVCKKSGCDGEAIWKPLTDVCQSFCSNLAQKLTFGKLNVQPPSIHGHKGFIACKKWRKDERYDHRYIQIEPNINEDELREMLDNGGRLRNHNVTLNDKCSLVLHPRSKQGVCCKFSP
jgi:hypothetical protein